MAQPSASRAASASDSAMVGCGRAQRARSSSVASIWIASAAAPMISVAKGDRMWTPSSSRYCFSATTLMTPPLTPWIMAMGAAAIAAVPVTTSCPAASACSSDSPTEAAWGLV